MSKSDHIIEATVFDYAFDSKNCVQYCPGWKIEFNVTTGRMTIPETRFSAGFERHLFWLRTPSKKWVFTFDRANSSNTMLGLFFCKECGHPFDKLTGLGTHNNEFHNKTKAHIGKVQAENDDEAEAAAIQEQLKIEAGEAPTAELDAAEVEAARRKEEIKQKRIKALNSARAAKRAKSVISPAEPEQVAQEA